jgi:hypothetical protein
MRIGNPISPSWDHRDDLPVFGYLQEWYTTCENLERAGQCIDINNQLLIYNTRSKIKFFYPTAYKFAPHRDNPAIRHDEI